ncbi:RagB/SusD family nutrient uptake outer membrane protein [Niabella sp. 3A5MI-3]|nr:RagB/SusD family nutrient uptake outer membrane protein [Niabella beijingensis]
MLLAGNFGCKKNFLDKSPEEDITLDSVFTRRSYAERWLAGAYSNIPTMANAADDPTRNPFTGACDEMEITYTRAYSHLLNSGAWSADYFWPDIWGYMYEGIRKTNIFIDNVDRVPMDATEKKTWKAEAILLRAMYHFFLARIHGPIPIADHTYKLDDDFYQIHRSPIDSVIGFIAADCDRAAADLPMKVSLDKIGRVTRATALALKAQALLYMASPLWNGNPDYANVANRDGLKLFPGYDAQRWRAAANAAKQCIDECEAAGYRLYRSSDNDPVKNYQQLFLVRNNEEVLYARLLGFNSHFERCSNPLGYGGFSIFCPLQELVDAYEMDNGMAPIIGYNTDGSPVINTSSGYVETGYATDTKDSSRWRPGIRKMYTNREPRFYASINFSGAEWKGRKIELWNSGKDGKGSAGSDYCISGYLQKKCVDPNSDIIQNRFSLNTFIYYRLGEQYLNYAEALNEAEGPVADVYKYVDAIRNRAGLPGLPAGLSRDGMREKIRHERRIEMAFEAHRYFDTHRWKIAQNLDNKEIHGMNIAAGTGLQDDAFYKRTVIEKRVFVAPKHYLWPIQQAEINKNPNLVQNQSW